MKKILCATVLASNFLLGIGDVSAMEVKPQNMTLKKLTFHPMAEFSDLMIFEEKEVEKIEINDKLFKESTAEKIATAINLGDVESLAESELSEQFSFPRLIKLFEDHIKIV